MESIGGYASDEDSPEKDTLTQDESKGEDRSEFDNYDNIQMDMIFCRPPRGGRYLRSVLLSSDSNSNSVSNASRGSAARARDEDAVAESSCSRDSRLSSSNGDRRPSPGNGERRPSTEAKSGRENRPDRKHRADDERSGRGDDHKREPDCRPKDRKPDRKAARKRSRSPEKDRRKDGKGRSPSSGHSRLSPSSSKEKKTPSLRKDEKSSSSPRREEKKRNGSPRRDEKRSWSPRKDEKKSRSPRKDEKKRSRSPRKDEKKRSRSPRRNESKKSSSPRREEKKRSSTPRKEGDRKRSCSPRKEDSKRSKRSPERFHRGNRGGGRFDKKPSKLSILERLGISVPGVTEFPLGVTAQAQLAQRALAAQAQLANGTAGAALPSYYNPAAMNPARYAEQIQKRKLLWGNKPETKVETKAEVIAAPAVGSNNWEATTFRGDQEGKMTAKFKRLMGIKEPGDAAGATSTSTVAPPEGDEILRKQEEMFQSMEMQYEVARVATHTHRGLGLGFGAFQYPR